MKHLIAISAALTIIFPGVLHSEDAAKPLPKLELDLTKPGAKVSPMLYGLMTEEINHSYDGGIYAELIQNRIFKDDPKAPAHWSVVQHGDSSAAITLDDSEPINAVLKTCLKLDAKAEAGVANDGFWGISVKPDTTYRASFYAKSNGALSPLTVSIESNDGAKIFAKAQTQNITSEWQRYEITLTTGKDAQPSANNRFVITTSGAGTYWFNLVSLFPPTFNNRSNGNRVDIMQLLADMKPKFLRLPGGNFLEGDWFHSRFDWKKTLGPLEQRPGHPGCWGYRASDGMGLLEFLEWCEDLKMEPLLAVFAGYTLKGDYVSRGPLLQPFVDEALEEIEYVIGDTSTKWGAQRAKDGHPAPFKLTYVEIGNEDGFDESGSYEGRFVQFYDAIKAKYPQLQLISTIGGRDTLGRKFAMKERTPDAIDEHYYRNAWAFEEDAMHYDDYDRKGPKIFVGEWASHETSFPPWDQRSKVLAPTPNMLAALGDAAWMTGMERNSDIVVMNCSAPLFVNVNHGAYQWRPNLIGYDALNSYGSPSYYAQVMFGQYLGDTIVPIAAQNVPTQPQEKPGLKEVPSLFFVATRADTSGTIFLKIVNTAPVAQPVQVELKGAKQVAREGTTIALSAAKLEDTNSIQEPTKIVPVKSKANDFARTFTHTLAPYSINVLQISAK